MHGENLNLLIVLSMKLSGYNEFSLRLPSAVSCFTTAIIIFILIVYILTI